jgi:hypothetical protein
VSIYELAKRVDPGELADHESKVIWNGGNGNFAYLFRDDKYIMLRLSGSQFQLPFYAQSMDGSWEIVSEDIYKETAQLWQDERLDRI